MIYYWEKNWAWRNCDVIANKIAILKFKSVSREIGANACIMNYVITIDFINFYRLLKIRLRVLIKRFARSTICLPTILRKGTLDCSSFSLYLRLTREKRRTARIIKAVTRRLL